MSSKIVHLPLLPAPRPSFDDTGWMAGVPCADNPDEWFREDELGIQRARRTCLTECGSREQCLERAIATGSDFGVFGGLSARQRRVLARKRERQMAEAS